MHLFNFYKKFCCYVYFILFVSSKLLFNFTTFLLPSFSYFFSSFYPYFSPFFISYTLHSFALLFYQPRFNVIQFSCQIIIAFPIHVQNPCRYFFNERFRRPPYLPACQECIVSFQTSLTFFFFLKKEKIVSFKIILIYFPTNK